VINKILILSIIIIYTACSPKYNIVKKFIPPQTKEGKICIKECDKKRTICKQNCQDIYNRCLTDAREKANDRFKLEMKKYNRDMREYNSKMYIFNAKMRRHLNKIDKLTQQIEETKNICENDIKIYKRKISCNRLKKIYKRICKHRCKEKKCKSRHISQNIKKNIAHKLSCKKHKKIYKDKCSNIVISQELSSCQKLEKIKDELEKLKSKKLIEPDRPEKPILLQLTRRFQSICSNNCNCSNDFSKCFISCGGDIEEKKVCIENCK